MSTSTKLDDLQRRLLDLQDVEAIESLKARYWRAIDRKNPAAVEHCFIADAIVDFEGLPRFASREAFMALVRQEAKNTATYNMHHGQNPVITLTGQDAAQGDWDIFYYGIDVATATLVEMAGVYHDTYVREAGEWRIATTKMRTSSLQIRRVDLANKHGLRASP